ncbi:oxoene reductase [Acrasis kona]|uniref:Oxoene reductase n=1 Tax=Acrasis kona TaxID=1008807 RepID=A0AAW2YTH3_9EUKA
MKAVVMKRYGTSDSALEFVEDHPIPEVEADKILIKLKYASVNPVDWKIRDGIMRPFFPPKFPYILGRDGSGIVTQVGNKIKNFKEGDEVVGTFSENGGYAQYVACKENDICIKPKELTWDVAASFPLVALTVYQMFQTSKIFAEALQKRQTNLLPEKRVLIVGASGGTGSLAVLLAKHYFGSYVYAVCGTSNIDYVKSLGADVVIDYKNDDFANVIPTFESEQGRPIAPYIDLALDCAGGADADAISLMDNTGTFSTIAPPKNANTLFGATSLVGGFAMNKFKQYTGYGPSVNFVMMKSNGEQLDHICKWMVEQNLSEKINIEQTFKLDDTKVAHKTSEEGRTRGKILLEIPDK